MGSSSFTAGYSGASGTSGYSGYSGYSGTSGAQGNSNLLTLAVAQASHGFAAGDIVYETSTANTYAKALADSAADGEVVGIVTAVADSGNFTLTVGGIVTAGVPVATAGTVMFLSDSVSGTLTSTEPSVTGSISKPLAVILQSGTRMVFHNFRGYVIGGVNRVDWFLMHQICDVFR